MHITSSASRAGRLNRPITQSLGLLAVVTTLATPSAKAQTIIGSDEGGRRIYVNADDTELVEAARRGGAAAARRVVEQRKRSLPGIQQYIDRVSYRYGIDSALVNAIIDTESAWNQRARSNKGALGLMQLLPETGRRFGVRDLFDPRENVAGGVRYLRFLLDRFEGNLRLVLAAYNAGEQAVAARGDVPPLRRDAGIRCPGRSTVWGRAEWRSAPVRGSGFGGNRESPADLCSGRGRSHCFRQLLVSCPT